MFSFRRKPKGGSFPAREPVCDPLDASLRLYSTEKLAVARSTVAYLSRVAATEFEIVPVRGTDKVTEDGIRALDPAEIFRRLCLYGRIMLKIYYNGTKFGFETVCPINFKILSRSTAGEILSAEFYSRAEKDGELYLRTERHLRNGNSLVITNSAVRLKPYGEDEPVPLDCSPWSGLASRTEIVNFPYNLFSELSTSDGKPIFSRGEALIEEANRQFDRLIWEYEGGELAVDASKDAFRIGLNGKPELPSGKERLYRTNLLDACSSSGELLKVFAPELRDKSYIDGLNRILMLYEDAVGLSRGTFSDPDPILRSATEVRAGQLRTFSIISGLRASLIAALSCLSGSAALLAGLYGLKYTGMELKIGDGVTDAKTKTLKI